MHEIAKAVSALCLRKDFVVDDYQIYEAKLLGAQAVLLICSILSDAQIKHMLELSNELGLSALVEAHDSDEVKLALDCGARRLVLTIATSKIFLSILPTHVVYARLFLMTFFLSQRAV